MSTFHNFQFNTTLVELYLQKYGFDCHDIETMMLNGYYNCTLQTLNLGSNNIGDHGIFHLAKWLIKRPALKALILCRNNITDNGARYPYNSEVNSTLSMMFSNPLIFGLYPQRTKFMHSIL